MADIERVGGGTPLSEARLEEKRRVLRRALKKEYMNQRYNPEMYMQGRRVFDTAFHRWNAMQNSGDLLVKHSTGNALKYFGTFVLPTIIVGYSIYRAQMEYDRRARAGEWPINAKNRKWLWYAS